MRPYLIAFTLLIISLSLAEDVTVTMPSEGFMSVSNKLKAEDAGEEAVATSYLSWDDKNKQLFNSMFFCKSVGQCSGLYYWVKGDKGCVTFGDVFNGTEHNDVYHWRYAAGPSSYSNMGESVSCKPDFKPVNFLGLDGVTATCFVTGKPDDEVELTFSSKKPSFETLHGISAEDKGLFAIYTGARGTVYTAPDWPAGCDSPQFASRSSIQEKLSKMPSLLKVFGHI